MGADTVRVVIGEDEALLRRGLELVLDDGGYEIVASVGDAPALEAAVAQHVPQLLVTDIRMPPTHTDDGLRSAIRLRAAHPDLSVVVLSQHVRRAYARELLAGAGAGVGYLLKQRISDIAGFLQALTDVRGGATVLDPEVARVLVGRAGRSDSPVGRLTPRQREVLELVAEGRSNASIAAALHLTEKSVVQHVSRIYDALGLAPDADSHRRVRAVVHYLDES